MVGLDKLQRKTRIVAVALGDLLRFPDYRALDKFQHSSFPPPGVGCGSGIALGRSRKF